MAATIPSEWREVLTKIKIGGFPEAVIAGGALRDLVNGVPVKDVDIFVKHTTTSDFVSKMDKLFGELGWRPEIHEASTEYMSAAFDQVVTVSSVFGYSLPIQIIGLSVEPTVEAAMARFDFGMCQILYDGTATVMTPAFVEDARNKEFTLIRSDNQDQFDRSMARWKRFEEKYPTHRMIVPGQFWPYAKAAGEREEKRQNEIADVLRAAEQYVDKNVRSRA